MLKHTMAANVTTFCSGFRLCYQKKLVYTRITPDVQAEVKRRHLGENVIVVLSFYSVERLKDTEDLGRVSLQASIRLRAAAKARSIRTRIRYLVDAAHTADRDLLKGRLRDLLVSVLGAYISYRTFPFQAIRPVTSHATAATLHSYTSSGPHLRLLVAC